MALLFAATYPERTAALALFHPHARPDEPDEYDDEFMERVRFEWGTQEFCDQLLQEACPTLFARGEEARLWFANEMRVGLSPEFAYALNRAFAETDLRPVLPAVKAPTLVFYREGSVDLEQHREVAARIEGAHEVRLPGSDYWGIFLSPEIVDELERFGEVLVSSTVKDLVAGSGIEFDDRGHHELKGVPGEWRVYAVD